MDDDLDERRIMQRIREDLKLRARNAESSWASTGLSAITGDLSLLQAHFDILQGTPVRSTRKILGPAVTFAKKLMRRMLAPILERQVHYNGANSRVVQELKTQLERSAQEQRSSVAALQEEVRRLIVRQEGLDRRTARLESEPTRQEIARAERKMRRLFHFLEMGSGQPVGTTEATRDGDRSRLEPSTDHDLDYVKLEERFRGTRAEIKARQRQYLRHFEGKGPVLDVGCGRGEFLELLGEAGLRARGVDLNLDLVLLCRDKGLDVAHGDAFAYLQGLPDASLGGVFSAQFIEHCRPQEVFRLAQLCERKLRPGGALVFETINPKCLSVFARSFYLDPTHVWPVHPELARFILDTAGFTHISLEFSSPVDPEVRLPYLDPGTLSDKDKKLLHRSVDMVNELLFGDQEYAIVGAKSPLDTAPG